MFAVNGRPQLCNRNVLSLLLPPQEFPEDRFDLALIGAVKCILTHG
jgi:hypothetical protein